MSRPGGVHHHGPLAGAGAGAVAVLAGTAVILIAARRQLGEVATVIAWALMAAVVGTMIAAAVYVFLWLRYRIRNPELLAGRHMVTAEVITPLPGNGSMDQAATPVPYAGPAAIEPPREIRLNLNLTPDQLAAIMRHHSEEE